jgi:hypothetical protein
LNNIQQSISKCEEFIKELEQQRGNLVLLKPDKTTWDEISTVDRNVEQVILD